MAFKVLLISAPWALFHRPSIQLATLRSYLLAKGGCAVTNQHLYLHIARKIDIGLYSRIARSGWAGDALFTPLLFPDKRRDGARLFDSELRGDGHGPVPDFDSVIDDVKTCCDAWLSSIDFETISLAGFSVCFSQLPASLYLASRIKEKAAVATVFGGSSCSGSAGRSLVEQFRQIDYLIDGEGERPLLELCRCLGGRQEILPKQIRTRHAAASETRSPDIGRLDDLPIPDFKPFLEEARHLFGSLPFMPILPVEFSRGCRWNRCTFCNLNLQWHGYRHKSSKRMAAEVKELSVRSESLNFAFTDNMLPHRELDHFFEEAADMKLDFSFFGEIRAGTDPGKLRRYRRGGLHSVQVGIEALSSSLLLRMRKGTTVMDNVAMMKHCCASDIILQGNIITEFPSTTGDEIEETLLNLEFVLPYQPLDSASFFLGYGSPVHCRPREHGIRAVTAHPKNRMLFPKPYLKGLLIAGYRGDRQLQQRLWRPVRDKIQAWQDFHRTRSGKNTAALSYRDGGDYLFIQQELPGKEPLIHRLRGTSRTIYLFCEEPKTVEDICRFLPSLDPQTLEQFIGQLCSKRLMFREQDRVLSLAVHGGRPAPPQRRR
jgi:ribosomal peptide maturation radical SAM protein 1